MHLLEVLVITFALSTELFTMAVNNAMEQDNYSNSLMFRMVLIMTLIQVIFLAIGWLIGHAFFNVHESIKLLLAFAIFVIVGLKMIWESIRLDPRLRTFDMEKTNVLVTIASVTGISSLVIGTGMNLSGLILFVSLVSVAVMSFLSLIIGSFIGKRFGCRFRGRFAKTLGGILFLAAGVRCILVLKGIIPAQ